MTPEPMPAASPQDTPRPYDEDLVCAAARFVSAEASALAGQHILALLAECGRLREEVARLTEAPRVDA